MLTLVFYFIITMPSKRRVSRYADDASIFVGPSPQDLIAITTILTCCGGTTRLKISLAKTKMLYIRCNEEHIIVALEVFLRGAVPSHVHTLSVHLISQGSKLPISNHSLTRLGGRLAGWKGKHFTRARRAVLVRSVLSSMVTYYLRIFVPNGC